MWVAFQFPAPFKSWALFDTGPYISFGLFLDYSHFLPYYSIILAVMTQSCWASLGQPFTLSPNGLTWPLVFLFMGSCVPFVFLLGILGLFAFFGLPWPFLLTLHSHGLLLTSLGFPGPLTLFSSLGFMGLPLTPYFLCLHYFEPAMAFSHFSISYTTHGYAISLFPASFKPTCLFKAHLFISWPFDPLFLSLGPNGFAICLPILCYPCRWAFFFLLGLFENDPQQLVHIAYASRMQLWIRICNNIYINGTQDTHR